MDKQDIINEFINELDLNGLDNLTENKIIELKNLSEKYRLSIQPLLMTMTVKEFFYYIIEKLYIQKKLFITINEQYILFNDMAEILAFIIYTIDPNYNMMHKYKTFLEETTSNTQAIVLHKQYAEHNHTFFESKILYGELILQKKEQEFKMKNNHKRKRTIIG